MQFVNRTLANVTLVLVLAPMLGTCVAGCSDTDTTSDASQQPVDRIEEALLGTSKNCDRGADCASGVCQMGLCRSLLDSDQAWMEKAVADRVRAYIKNNPEVADQLFGDKLAALDGGDPFGQGRFAAFMGHLGDKRALPVLKNWSNSQVERVSVLALLARVRLRDESAYSHGKTLLHHRSLAVQLDALDALAPVLKEAGVVHDVLNLLESPKYRIRQRAVITLGRLAEKPPEVTAALESLLSSESDGFIRGDVLRALGR